MKNEETNRTPRKRNTKCETRETIARAVDEKFKEYLAFNAYVRQEVDRETKSMYKTLTIIGVALSFVVGIGGYFGFPALINMEVQKFLETVTSQQSLSVISNQSASIVQRDVPKMISDRLEISVKDLKSQIGEIEKDKNAIRQELKDASDTIEKVSKAESLISDKLALLDTMAAARAGDRKSYEQLLSLSASTNQNATLAKNAVAEINWRYQQRRYAFRTVRVRLQRPDLQLSNADFVSIVHADFDWNCDGAINELVDTNDRGFVETLVHAVMTSKRLDSVDTAIEGIQALTGRSFKALGIDEVSNWWTEAKTNAVYHSGYERYQKLRKETESLSSGVPVDRILGLLRKAENLTKDYPSLAPAWEMVTILISRLPAEVRFADGRQELCAEALQNFEKHNADKIAPRLRAIFLAALGLKGYDFTGLANDAITRYADFETRARKSHLFTDAFFNDPAINWHGKPTAVAEKPLSRKINSDHIVGYVTITIRKGRRALLELPVNNDTLQTKNTLATLGGGVDGDEISWTINERSYCYAFQDGHWHDDAGEIADSTEVPVGDAILYYDRKADVETRLTFSGQFETP